MFARLSGTARKIPSTLALGFSATQTRGRSMSGYVLAVPALYISP
jgi:hypothetical protein